jgi:ribosomal protein S8
MEKVTAEKVFYIKLGQGGEFVEECFYSDPNIVKLHYHEVPHALCINGDWLAVLEELKKGGHSPGTSTNHLRQIKSFYEEGENTIWVTFHDNKLWWCRAETEITVDEKNLKSRRVIGKWSDQDIDGNKLLFGNLSGELLTTKAYRGTICSVDKKYVLRKINNQLSVEAEEIKALTSELQTKIAGLIQKLYWNDLELFVDLVFRQSGWRRVSYLGKQEKTIDLDLESTVTGERAVVQIKATSTKEEFRAYENKFEGLRKDYQKVFYVCPQPKNGLEKEIPQTGTILYFSDKLAELAISAGLVDWLIKKCG